MKRINVERLRELSLTLPPIPLAKELGVTRSSVVRLAARKGISLLPGRKLIDYTALPQLAAEGLTYKEIAKRVGAATQGGISRVMKKLVPNHVSNRRDILIVRRMARMMTRGIPIAYIAKLHKTTPETVRSTVLRRLGKGIRSPRRTGKGNYGLPVSDELIGRHAAFVKKQLLRANPYIGEEIDAAVAYAALEMQEWPEVENWKARYLVIARSRLIDETRTVFGYTGGKMKVKKCGGLADYDVATTPDDSGEIQEYIRKKIENLPDIYRDTAYAYLQANGGGQRAAEIAGIPLGTYWTRLRMMMNLLRENCHEMA